MTDDPPGTLSDKARLLLVTGLSVAFMAFGVAVSGVSSTFSGLVAILSARDMLLTDYVELAGLGPAFANAGLLTLITVAIYWRAKAEIGGAAVACMLLVLGFALFGKNVFNVWPILGGVYLYSRYRGEPLARHLNTAFFGFALAPVVSEILFSSQLERTLSLPLALITGLLIGFVMPPIAAQLFRAHDGHNLYNMGFTAGMIGTIVVSIFLMLGFVPEPVFLWATDVDAFLAPFLIAIFLAMIAVGRWVDDACFGRFRKLLCETGQAPSDFLKMYGDGAVLVNMGTLGLISTSYVFLIGSTLNGATVGGILSVVGFGAFGKHPFNCIPIAAGVFLASLLIGSDPASPGVVLAALFSTSLAPIAGRFGWHWGVLTGAIHLSVAQSVGVLHAGLNLYNNGFAAGIVATLVAPVILSINSRERNGTRQKP